jgi:hypothetical protein
MANVITAFFERLTAAEGAYNDAKVSELAALGAVWLDLRPEAARQGQTIRLYFPDLGPFIDQGNNDWVTQELNPTYIDVPFGQRPGTGIVIRDMEQVLTSTNIVEQFIDPAHKRAMEYANGQIWAQVTAANFNTYPAIACAPGTFGIGDARLAWNILKRNKVPISGPDNASILYHTDVHANTLTDSNWYQESLVGAMIARDTRQNVAQGDANLAFRFRRAHDQQATTAQTSIATTHAVTNGSAAVTGTTSAYTTTAPVGSWITFGSDLVSYQVKTVTDDTHIILSQPYAGTTSASTTATRTTYVGVAMHKYAIALAVRPLELPNSDGVSSRLMNLGGLPVRAQVSYQHLKGGHVLTWDYVMVCRVIRPDFGVVFTS